MLFEHEKWAINENYVMFLFLKQSNKRLTMVGALVGGTTHYTMCKDTEFVENIEFLKTIHVAASFKILNCYIIN